MRRRADSVSAMVTTRFITHSAQEMDSAAVNGRRETVLIVALDPSRRDELTALVQGAGWVPLFAGTPDEARQVLLEAPPDLLLLDCPGTSGAELEVLDRYRADADGVRVPIVCLLAKPNRRLTIDAFGRRADDVISGLDHPDELRARLRVRLERPPVPRTELTADPVTGALTSGAFAIRLGHELARVSRGGPTGTLALLALDELPGLEARLGSRARDEVTAQVVRLIREDGRTVDLVGLSRGLLGLLLPNTAPKGAPTFAQELQAARATRLSNVTK